MTEQILVPALGESITEATVSKWLKKPGEKVAADDPIVELETDKVNLEVPSPIDGIFSEKKANEGDTVLVGAVLGIIELRKETNVAKEKTENKINLQENKIEESKNVEEIKHKDVDFEKNNEEPLVLSDDPLLLNDLEEEKKFNKEEILSPAVRKIVSEKKIDTKEKINL